MELLYYMASKTPSAMIGLKPDVSNEAMGFEIYNDIFLFLVLRKKGERWGGTL